MLLLAVSAISRAVLVVSGWNWMLIPLQDCERAMPVQGHRSPVRQLWWIEQSRRAQILSPPTGKMPPHPPRRNAESHAGLESCGVAQVAAKKRGWWRVFLQDADWQWPAGACLPELLTFTR